ncbi:hypothetical protein THAOC_29224 [Thalassiosira oceanica]|uniref:Uncharacterized protein n=1 Tax=Thalassiosira oceanica TaxID=159749 RepID=K0RY25_THAOC|nr:hypothetical protein THAOC_29224 [Thalassiosira oceanica]|eukprot:EJK51592.1 hypothetical protein THAOC_29224 [Thalassiosira oceanica]
MKASAILFAGAVAASSAAAVDRETDPDRPRQGRTRKRVSSRDSSASQIDIGATSDGARRSTLTSRGIQGNSRLFNPLDRNLREQRKGRGQKTNHEDESPLGRHKRSSAKKPINKRLSAKSDKPDTRSKSGKSGKSESYHIAPFSCPGQCIDAEGADYETGELSSAVQACNVHGSHGYTQQWLIHQDTTFVKAESYAYEGQCIGVVYEPGDSAEDIKGACEYAELALRPCDSPSTNWYFTGGQLLSAFAGSMESHRSWVFTTCLRLWDVLEICRRTPAILTRCKGRYLPFHRVGRYGYDGSVFSLNRRRTRKFSDDFSDVFSFFEPNDKPDEGPGRIMTDLRFLPRCRGERGECKMVRSSEESLHIAFIKCHVLLCILIGSCRDRDDYLLYLLDARQRGMCGHQSNLQQAICRLLAQLCRERPEEGEFGV